MERAAPIQLPLPMDSTQSAARWHELPASGELERLRAALPSTVQLGTCGWLHPGWLGSVWSEPRTVVELEQNGLQEYAAHPLLTTAYVQHHREEYADGRELRIYAAQLPAHMHCVMQVHPEVTTARFTHQDVSGVARGRAGQVNRHFLDTRFFVNEILEVYQNALGARLGTFLFTFPPTLRRSGISPAVFAERLDRFLSDLPKNVTSAIELREPEYLTGDYRRLLASHAAGHVFTTWPGMPSLAEQARFVLPAARIMIQVLDPTGRPGRRVRFQPFDQIRAANPTMRHAVVDLILATRGIPTYVLTHNDAEGSAPLTLLALARMLVAELAS
jgi:uncharacterized protein YecE (DUF72 family)